MYSNRYPSLPPSFQPLQGPPQARRPPLDYMNMRQPVGMADGGSAPYYMAGNTPGEYPDAAFQPGVYQPAYQPPSFGYAGGDPGAAPQMPSYQTRPTESFQPPMNSTAALMARPPGWVNEPREAFSTAAPLPKPASLSAAESVYSPPASAAEPYSGTYRSSSDYMPPAALTTNESPMSTQRLMSPSQGSYGQPPMQDVRYAPQQANAYGKGGLPQQAQLPQYGFFGQQDQRGAGGKGGQQFGQYQPPMNTMASDTYKPSTGGKGGR